MSNPLQVGRFKVVTTNGQIAVCTESGQVTMNPAEADIARSAIGSVVRMSKFKALPPKLVFPPFEAIFSEDPDEDRFLCELKRTGSTAPGCKFAFSEGDEMLGAVEMGTRKVIDELRIGGGARPGVSMFSGAPDPVIEGKG